MRPRGRQERIRVGWLTIAESLREFQASRCDPGQGRNERPLSSSIENNEAHPALCQRQTSGSAFFTWKRYHSNSCCSSAPASLWLRLKQRLPFLDTYRTMCNAPSADFLQTLKGISAVRVTV